jgi:GntR family transcriptional regulator, transcriptional repressor for pyruvate dehydrogenase complex
MMPQFHMRNTLVVDVVGALRHMILSGEILPGQFLPSQKELSSRFGVALSTIHEAIQVLSSAGLVQSRPGKGTWIREDALDGLIHPVEVRSRFGDLDLRMVAEARLVMETALTEFAAERASEADIICIREALEKMRATVDDETAFVAADIEFHIAVAQAGGNELLEQVYYVARGLLTEAVSEMVHSREVRLESIELQARIAEAIARHDVAAARRDVREHMGYVTSLVEKSSPKGEETTLSLVDRILDRHAET